ncbi:MAG: SDR family NAD(P)-dependent oxidoreductase [Myxococcales bacterium]|nr:SDR family NAD(P)-dependent oxidoreductase [Myxococcales bacterium]MDP3499212.1 SDR family NAD(P)-dependent oxidoreductase [Myxococcales bacterium]
MKTPKDWVLVTGASSGIGAASVDALIGGGFGVFAGVRRDVDSKALVTAHGPRVVPVRLDVRKDRDVLGLVARLRRSLRARRLHGLVNAAGIAFAAPLEWTSPADLSLLFEVNVTGAFRVTRAVLPRLRADRGRIVNVSSGAGQVTAPGTAAYSASKFALESLSDGLRLELASAGVHVSVIEPGAVATPLWERLEAQMARVEREAPAASRAAWKIPWANVRGVLAEARALATPAPAVARLVVEALTAEVPRARYSATPKAELLAALAMDDAERDRQTLLDWGLTPRES